jgi:DeoR/GlpR family transcriptional regulator of sugar metabolism
MTEVHFEEAQLKRKAIESSKKVLALVDASKFGKEDLTPFACPSQVTHLFTDSSNTDEYPCPSVRCGIITARRRISLLGWNS